MNVNEFPVVEPAKGSGFGPFVKGEPITSPKQVKVGDLLCDYTIQFDARNIVRVTQTEFDAADGEHFYGIFVDPTDTSKPRIGSTGEINFWDWEINPVNAGACSTILHRAILPANGHVTNQSSGVSHECH